MDRNDREACSAGKYQIELDPVSTVVGRVG